LTGAWHGSIREELVADRDALRNQRHAAKRTRDRHAEKKGVSIAESQYRTVTARIRAKSPPRSGRP
jgi:hypothetical protein